MNDDSENSGGSVTVEDVLAGERGGVVDFASAREGGSVANFDPSLINEVYAVVLVGGSAAVLEETWKLAGEGGAVPLQDRVRLLSTRAFETWFKNEKYYTSGDKQFSAAQLWLAHPARRQYTGMVFDPVSTPPGYFNLFQGFPYDWAMEADGAGRAIGTCDLFLDHVRANICNSDEDLFARVIAWAAHIFQKPAERLGVALALRGGKGTGKTIFGEVLGALLGLYWLIVDHPRYVTGQFNAHMATLLLLQADEAFWAGSKEGEGALKGLITSREHLIERKNVDPQRMANYVRILVTSNEEWAVPASYDERRWMVLDVAEHAKQNRGYFAALFAELEADGGAGYAALFKYLMDFDLSKVDLSRIPQTRGLLDQKLRSLTPPQEWWHECLWQGWIAPTEDGFRHWPDDIDTEDVHTSYLNWKQRKGVRGHTLSKAQLSKDVLHRFAPGLTRYRASGPGRPPRYRMPDLQTCRAAFDEWIGGGVGWLSEDGTYEAPVDVEE